MAANTRSNAASGSGSDASKDGEEPVALTSLQFSQLASLIGEVVDKKIDGLKESLGPGRKADGEAATAKAKRRKTGKHGGHEVSDSDADDADKDEEKSDGEVSDDEADAYMNDLDDIMEIGERTGPDLPERIVGVLKRTIGTPIDTRAVKEKRDAFPRPGNAPNLKVPKLDPTLRKATTAAGRLLDKKLAEMQANMAAAMTSVAKQATVMYELKSWAKSKAEPAVRDKVELMSKTFVELMDANILLTRAMSDATYARREALKFTLTEDVASVLSEENPATAEWLGGEDIAAALDRVEKEKKQVSRFKKPTYSFQDKSQGSYNNKGGQHKAKQKHGQGKYDKTKSRSQGKYHKSSKKDFRPRGPH